MAYIRTATGATTPSEIELVEFLREHLSFHKTPRQWFFVDSFPMNASGKVQKFLLRELDDPALVPALTSISAYGSADSAPKIGPSR